MVTREQILDWLRQTAETLDQNKEYLTGLDAAIGDADHGANMHRGFQRVMAQLPSMADKDIGGILKAVGMALIASVGGAGGPLYGTFFMRAAMAVDGKQELNNQDLASMLQAGLEGVVQRGRANEGDKTMVDALAPAARALNQAAGQGLDTVETLRLAVDAAENGAKETIPMVAKKGRASYLGERSAGHQDPGATSSYLILNALLEVASRGNGS